MVEIKSCIQWENHVSIGICGYNFLVSAQKTKKGILHKNIENTWFLDGEGVGWTLHTSGRRGLIEVS